MNKVTPQNPRTVNTTVGELEPGTIFRHEHEPFWLMRIDCDSPECVYIDEGVSCYVGSDCKVVEIADSVTITKGVSCG